MPQTLTRPAVLPLIRLALREDGAFRDVTSRAVIPLDRLVRARLVAKAPGILAGGPMAAWTFQALDPSLRCVLRRRDGARLAKGNLLLTLEGRARSILAAERTALNLLGHLSGIATLTAAFVRRVRGTRAKIYDTRKTLPGLRLLEKYAVRVGGGSNHRLGLHDAVLIKTNHLHAIGGFQHAREALAKANQARQRRGVEVEVANLQEFRAALAAKPDAILLDNWTPARLRRVTSLRRGKTPLLEASGGVTLANVRAIARTGVDRISIGRLTHSAPALDVALHVVAPV